MQTTFVLNIPTFAHGTGAAQVTQTVARNRGLYMKVESCLDFHVRLNIYSAGTALSMLLARQKLEPAPPTQNVGKA